MSNSTIATNNKNSKFNLILCELFNSNIHGPLYFDNQDNKEKQVNGHYLVIDRFDGRTRRLLDIDNEYDIEDEFTDTDESDSDNGINSDFTISTIDEFAEYYNDDYYVSCVISHNLEPHSIIRNYENIISKPDYIKPEIAECIVLETQHCVAIIKTIWIRLIQRKWKKVYAERKNILRKRMSTASLSTRELTGVWPEYCRYLPSIHGILSNLKHTVMY
jgi:hypothetical protein